jgi:uncharacterized protein YndB with AHSA1/START domain
MAKMRFQTTIQRNAKSIYDLLANISGYQSWLPLSGLYGGVREISDHPVRIGTTYVDGGTSSVMNGTVTELEPDRRVTFVQRMRRSGWPGSLEIQIRYTLETSGEFSTLVTREIMVKTRGIFLLFQPVLLGTIRKENERIMQQLKSYLEAR